MAAAESMNISPPPPAVEFTVRVRIPESYVDYMDELAEEAGRDRDEAMSELVAKWIDDWVWETLCEYGQRKAAENGITDEVILQTCAEVRAERAKARQAGSVAALA